MRLDPLNAFVEPRQRNSVPDHRLMVLVQRQSQLTQPDSDIIDFSAVLVEQFGDLIKSVGVVIRSPLDVADAPRHLGEQLVDSCEVDAVAALHCGKKDTPRGRSATAQPQPGPALRASRAMKRS